MKILPRIMLLLACIMPLGADDLPVVTLEDAITAAADSNTGLQQAAVTLNKEIRKADNYLSTYLPTLSLTGAVSTGANFPGISLPAYAGGGKTPNTTFSGLTFSAGVSAEFTFSGNMLTDSTRRRLSRESAALDYESSYDSIESGITTAYWNLAAADMDIENAKLAAEDAQRSYSSTLEMYENGMVDELALSQAEYYLEQMKYALKTVEDAKALQLSSFKSATGITEDFTTEPLPDAVMLSLPSPEALFAEYGEMTTAIRSARNTLAAAENGEDTYAMIQYMPALRVEVGYDYAGKTGEDNKWNYYDHSANGISGSVAISIPISSYIPGSSADEDRRDASDDVKVAALEVKNQQDTLLQTIRQYCLTIGQNQENLSITARNAAIAERTYNLTEEAFNAGLKSADELSTARKDLLAAQMNETSAELDHLLSCYNLAYTLGLTVSELQELYPATIEETV